MGGALTRMVGFQAAGDPLEAALISLNAAGKLVSSWFLPLANPTQYLTLNGASAEGWAAAYGSQKVDYAELTNPPQWDSTLYTSRGGLVFNGTSQFLAGTGNVVNWPDATSDLYLLIALTANATAIARQIFGYGDSASSLRSIAMNSTERAIARASGSQATSGVTANGTHTLGARFDLGGTSAIYIDGVSQGTVSTATAALTRTVTRMGASSFSTGPSQYFSGSIACAAVLNATATLTDFTGLEALMRARIT